MAGLGRCFCGRVRFFVPVEPRSFVACHCRDCQYTSGGGPAFVLVFPAGSIQVSAGADALGTFVSVSDSGNEVCRQFCSDCGTPLFERMQLRPEIELVRAGAMDETRLLRVDATVWTSSAQPWVHLDEGSQHFPRNPTPLNRRGAP